MQAPLVEEYTQKQVIENSQHASKVATDLLQKVIEIIKPGIKESQATYGAIKIFEVNGIKKNWHRPYIRFGTNTVLTYRDKSKEDKTLQKEDIAYMDIGPVIGDIEGDAGCTLTFGKNELFKELKYQSERIFKLGLNYWKKNNPTGIELYKYIYRLTEDAGYEFNLNPAGHLIGSFPHERWTKEGLGNYPYIPEPGMWVLEIQIRHPEKPYGAFYEAILL